MNPPSDLLERVERLVGARAVHATRATGGWSIAERWTVSLDDGRKVFAKLAPTDDIARFLRQEHRNMTAIDGDFVCDVIAFEDGHRPLLVVEDFSHARWPPPWKPGDVERVLETMARLANTPPPPHLQPIPATAELTTGWRRVAAAPETFLDLGVASSIWLERSLPTLIDAERSIDLDGKDLLHLDVRSDNLCFDGDRVILVDWNWASLGPRDLDIALWLSSLRLEGGPLPEEVLTGVGAYAAGFAGYLADSARQPAHSGAPAVRRFQLRQLRICLPWACRELGLPRPELDDVTAEISKADADLAAGTIAEDAWHALVEEPLTDAYLSHAEPWRQSGKGGDEADWRWGRELALDVARDGDAVLDVGCANGYLMESFHRWGAERGMRIEPYGVDISWRLASLARRRLPQWSDRIFIANVMKWTPPRRFDVVHTAMDYMPPLRRGEHIERVLRDFLVPGGAVVLRANRMPKGPDPAAEFEAAGIRPDGVIEATHPITGEIRRTAYVRSPVR